jgi:hypothetical protein
VVKDCGQKDWVKDEGTEWRNSRTTDLGRVSEESEHLERNRATARTALS